MAKRSVLILDDQESPLTDITEEFFEDTLSVPDKTADPGEARSLILKKQYSHFFINPKLINKTLAQALRVLRQTVPETFFYAFGDVDSGMEPFTYDHILNAESMSDFQKQVLNPLVFPEKLKVLVVDDEAEIGRMIQDFLERRVKPAFEVRHAQDGQAGIDSFAEFRPDVLILDIKMPVKDGREVYQEVHQRHGGAPTIVFFDAVAGHEISEMRQFGKPVIVEKGAPQSALPELLQTIKKIHYFS